MVIVNMDECVNEYLFSPPSSSPHSRTLFLFHKGAGASFAGYDGAEAVLVKAKANIEANPDNRCCKYLLQLKNSGKLDEMSPDELSKLFLCAKTGLDNVESGLGCYAMGPKDYEDFDFFFGDGLPVAFLFLW